MSIASEWICGRPKYLKHRLVMRIVNFWIECKFIQMLGINMTTFITIPKCNSDFYLLTALSCQAEKQKFHDT